MENKWGKMKTVSYNFFILFFYETVESYLFFLFSFLSFHFSLGLRFAVILLIGMDIDNFIVMAHFSAVYHIYI
jgi:hypothetical protein